MSEIFDENANTLVVFGDFGFGNFTGGEKQGFWVPLVARIRYIRPQGVKVQLVICFLKNICLAI